MQLDDSTHLNSELKEQVALAERRNVLLQSELEELRSLQEQRERGRRLAEEELLEVTERINLFHTQVGPISSPHCLHELVEGSGFPAWVSLELHRVAMFGLGCMYVRHRESLWLQSGGHAHLFPSALVSQGCCNRVPQTGWLKITELYSLWARRLKSRCWQGHIPSESPRCLLSCLFLDAGHFSAIFGVP